MKYYDLFATVEQDGRKENVQEFLAMIKNWLTKNPTKSFIDFVTEMSLISNKPLVTAGQKVILSTIHAAKGLEFKHVFLMALSEGIFPGKRAESDQEVEEERRLCYVAITRAKNFLYLSNYQWGGFRFNGANQDSRFLLEMNAF